MKNKFSILIIALVGITSSVYCQPACESNPAAGDFCSTAVPICNLNGYCGNTSSSYSNYVSPTNTSNETNTPLGNVFCATIQNNSWLKFIASATTAVFNVWVSNCANNKGIQMQIYQTSDCYSFTAVSNCWNPLVPTNGQIAATGLIPGNVYYFMIDGAQGDVCDYVIAANSGVAAPSISPDQSICLGSTALLTATNGESYLWTSNPTDPSLNGQNTNASITVAPAVTTVYSVNITIPGNNSFCPSTVSSLSTVVYVAPLPSFQLTTTDDHCGHSDGTATVIISGDSSAFTYLWSSTPVQQTTPTAVELTSGTYSVTVTDSNNCLATGAIAVYQNPNLEPEITGPAGFCEGNGALLDAGNDYQHYLWSNNATTQTLNVTSGGIYTVTVSDEPSCTGTDSFEIVEFEQPTPTITGPSFICSGSTGTLDVTTAYASYLWSDNSVLQSISISHGGMYIVTVTDTNGCSGSDSTDIFEKIPPVLSISSVDETCDLRNGIASITAYGAGKIFYYLWNTGDTTAMIDSLAQGTYTVTVDDGDCISQASVTIGEIPGPTAEFFAQPYVLTLLDASEPVTFNFHDLSRGSVVGWEWDFGDNGYITSSEKNTAHSYNAVGIYNVTLTVTDINNCIDSFTDKVKVKDVFTFYIPNSFTPDGDGVNDYFSPKGINVDPENFEMYIYNSWGNLMYHTNQWTDPTAEPWDGTLNNSGSVGNIVPGVYVYLIFANEIDGNIIHEYKGTITVLR